MPYQNRIDPYGNLYRPGPSTVRGALTGNRGRLHNTQGQIERHYEHKRWIFCRLDYPEPSHPVMAPGQWTHLFFLDEATALAGGHRPCALCLNPRFKAFQAAWSKGNQELTGGRLPTAVEIDAVLHSDRITKSREKMTYFEEISALPEGCFTLLEEDTTPYLVRGSELFPWSPSGYGPAILRPEGLKVRVLTPRSTVRALAAGYRPEKSL